MRATNGKVTSTVARTRPGTAKITCRPARSSIGPNQPLAPNSSTQTRPEITGETENGSSIRVISRLRPRNWKRPMHQAAASPHTVFSGTLIAATSNVSPIAATVSGSASASPTAASPCDSASVNTTASGSSRNSTSSTTVSDDQQDRVVRRSARRAAGSRSSRSSRPHAHAPLQRFSSSRMANDTSSMTSPSAAAPA